MTFVMNFNGSWPLLTRKTSTSLSMKAIGISRSSIAKTFLAESLCVCFLGMVIGVALGWGFSGILEELLKSSVPNVPSEMHLIYFTPQVVLQSALTAVLVGVLAGLAPLGWAIGVRPARTLRDD